MGLKSQYSWTSQMITVASDATLATPNIGIAGISVRDTDDVLVDLQKVCAYRFDLHHCTFQVTKDPKLA